MLGTCFYEHPYCRILIIIFIFYFITEIMTNDAIRRQCLTHIRFSYIALHASNPPAAVTMAGSLRRPLRGDHGFVWDPSRRVGGLWNQQQL